MSSLDGLRTRYYARRGVAQRIADNSSVALRLRYVGTGSVTSVTVTTATDITMVTTDGGTDAYTWANYTTVGALAAKINSDGIFQAIVLDALLPDATGASKIVDGAISAGADENGVVCWDMKVSTEGSDTVTLSLSPFRSFDPVYKGQGHKVALKGINYNVIIGTPAATSVAVYHRKGSVEALVWGALGVSTTDTAILFANGQGKLDSQDAGSLIVRISGGALTAAAANYLQIVGEIE